MPSYALSQELHKLLIEQICFFKIFFCDVSKSGMYLERPGTEHGTGGGVGRVYVNGI